MLDDFNSGSNDEPMSAPLQPVDLGGDDGAASTNTQPQQQPIIDNPYKVASQEPSTAADSADSQNEESKDQKD